MVKNTPLRVLFAEDVPADCEMAQRELLREGLVFASLCVETRGAFLDALERFAPDIVVSDYSMPQFDGMEALALAHLHDPLLPFVMLTGSMNEETAAECMRLGASDYVIKEHVSRLPFAVVRALERAEALRSEAEGEAALRASLDELAAIYENAPLIMLLVDSDRRVRKANAFAIAFAARTADEIIGLHDGESLRCVHAIADSAGCGLNSYCRSCGIGRAVVNTLETGRRHNQVEVSLPCLVDGHEQQLTFLLSTSPVDVRGTPYVLLTLLDITDSTRTRQSLRESLETYRALVGGLPDVVMRFDRNGRILFVSENVIDVVDLRPADLVGKTHRELGFAEPECRLWEESIQRVFDSGALVEQEFTFVGVRGPVVFDWRMVPEFQAGAVKTVLSIGRDVTAARRAEYDYRTLFREMLDGFAVHEIICDEKGQPIDYRFIRANPAFERLTGLKVTDILGKTVLEVMPGIEHYWIETYGKVALTGVPANFENYSADLKRHFRVSAFSPAPNQFACVFIDITDREQAREELVRSRHELRMLAAHVQNAREQERTGIARELHDTVGQALTAMKLDVSRIKRHLEAGCAPTQPDLDAVSDLLDQTADEVRRVSSELRPGVLDDIGLSGAIEWQVDQYRKRTDLDFAVDLPAVESMLDDIHKTVLFRVFQELLTNVVRHANASTVNVTLEHADGLMKLTVADDGGGIDLEKLDRAASLGITGMRERLRPFRGELRYESAPGTGTTAQVVVPVH